MRSDSETTTLQNTRTATDAQIDALVYELYGLTEKEIQLVEDSQIELPKAQREGKPEKQADLT